MVSTIAFRPANPTRSRLLRTIPSKALRNVDHNAELLFAGCSGALRVFGSTRLSCVSCRARAARTSGKGIVSEIAQRGNGSPVSGSQCSAASWFTPMLRPEVGDQLGKLYLGKANCTYKTLRDCRWLACTWDATRALVGRHQSPARDCHCSPVWLPIGSKVKSPARGESTKSQYRPDQRDRRPSPLTFGLTPSAATQQSLALSNSPV